MKIRIITDTPSDITIKEGKKLNIDIVPLKIIFDEKSYLEDIELSMEDFYKKLKTAKNLPTTSTPSPEDYLKFFEEAKNAGEEVIVITLSGSVSGTYQCANLAKNMANYSNIYIIDSAQATIGQRLLVEYAIQLREQGKTAKEIVEIIEEVKKKVVLYAMVDTLEYLHKGGRLSKRSTIAGTILKIKPIITLKEGAVSLIGKARGANGAMKTIFDLISQESPIDPSLPVYFGSTNNYELCYSCKEKADKKYNLTNTKMYPVGGVIGTHVGPGAYVIAYLKK